MISGVTRREFLEAGALGAAATFAASCSGSTHRPEPATTSPPSSVRALGRTGLKLPIVSIGSTSDASLIRRALDEGLKYVHTSSSYSERNHERMLGQALKGLSRDSFVLGTGPDLPARWPSDGGSSMDVGVGVDPGLIGQSMEVSLELLGLDYAVFTDLSTRRS